MEYVKQDCPFCELDGSIIVLQDPWVIVIKDAYPVSPGHSLILPRRHISSFFETTEEEQIALFKAMREAKAILDGTLRPDGYNIGINDGNAAGQTIMHLHIHIIPRYRGDTSDPRGGIRWLFPGKAIYWTEKND